MYFVAVSAIMGIVGCANYAPVIDTKNVDMNRYHADLKECQQYAQNENPAGQAAVGAIAGALLGAILSKAAGGNYDWQATSRVGAVTGAVAGGAHAGESQMDIIKNCLRGRGYNVLR